MPAAAVIPAPIGYINAVAVKKLVVEFLVGLMLLIVSERRCLTATRHFVDFYFVWLFTQLNKIPLRH